MYTFLTRQFSSFTYLNITQFLGALNDNIYKLLIALFLIQLEGVEKSSVILSTTGAIFVLPFLLFSSSSGKLADRFSKRNIIVITKIWELLVMAVGLLAFAFHSPIVCYITLFMLATHSAIFSPSKYGIIPELVESDKISRANGLLTSFSFLAIILGSFLATFITDITNHNFILGALFCTIISLAGVIMSFGIQYTPPAGSTKQFNVLFISEIYNTLKLAKETPSLISAMVGSAFFLFLGAFMLLNIIPFSIQSLGLNEVQGGYLYPTVALGIGIGAVLAGRLSGKSVELGFVPVAAIGISICLFLINAFSSHLGIVVPLLIFTGILGGLYQIPLDSFIQIVSPNNLRGQIYAATNFMSFTGVLFASGFVYLINDVLGLRASEGFSAMGFVAGGTAIYFTLKFKDYSTRLLSKFISKLRYATTFSNEECIPNTPAIYFSNQSNVNDLMLLLGNQPMRMRFYVDEEYKKGFPYQLLISTKTIPKTPNSKEFQQEINETLQSGFSVAFMVNQKTLNELYEQQFQETPLIGVEIQKKNRPLLRAPAQIIFKSK